jgi:hypothetical protein
LISAQRLLAGDLRCRFRLLHLKPLDFGGQTRQLLLEDRQVGLYRSPVYRFSAVFQRSPKISHTVLNLAGPFVRREKRVTHDVRSADQRVDTLLLKLQPTHSKLNARTHGRHLLYGAAQTPHFDEQRPQGVLIRLLRRLPSSRRPKRDQHRHGDRNHP